MRRTHKSFDFPAVTLTLPGASSSLSAFDRFARYRSRYLLHGIVAFVGVAALSTIALHPRPAPVAAAAAAPVVTDVTTPLAGVDVQAQLTTATDAAAATDTPVADTSADAPPTATDPPAEPAKPITHTVEAGETLRMLAARYSISPETIMDANGLTDPDMLQVGQDLVILPTDGVLYTLQAGESIKRVAEHFGVDVTDIVQANDLGPNPDLVQPGAQLIVPGAEPVLVSQAAADTAQADSSGDQQAAALGGGVSLPVDAQAHAVPSTRTYEVQDGDTLASIAQKFGVDINTILSSNGIDDPDTIHPGSDLSILPVSGLQYTVEPDETLADIAYRYQVDLGLLLDYNDLNDPDMIRVGAKLVVPGGILRPDTSPAPAAAAAPAPRTQSAPAGAAIVQVPAAPRPAAAAKPAPAKPAPAPAKPAPDLVTGGGGGSVVANAMKYLGYRYVFGGTSPSGFDCSGFVYYIHNHSGAPVSRSMWQQYNGGAHVSMDSLQPGDTVFFANTYEPGLSHDGIYIGGGKFIHAADENTGVTISSLYTAYWQAHYVGATRLWD